MTKVVDTKASIEPKEVKKEAELTDWAFADADTKQLTHEIHRYSGKYIPQVARRAIEIASKPGDIVLDPYLGSGTTLIEANLLGRHSHGIDINPLAVLISKVKTTPIPERRITDLLEFFENVAFEITSSRNNQPSIFSTSIRNNVCNNERYNDEWYRKWFNESILEELLILEKQIKDYPHKKSSDLALVAFSNILRRCSNAHSGYPNVMFDKRKDNKNDPVKLFIKSLKEISRKVSLIESLDLKKTKIKIEHGDATNLKMKDCFADAIITHPPYIGSVPYAEYGSLSLKWLGFEPKELDRKITGGKRQSKDVVARFKEGYYQMLSESYRVLKPDKYLFILIGDPTVKGEFIDLALMTRQFAEQIGFNTIVEKKREGVNRRANKMGSETVMFFQK